MTAESEEGAVKLENELVCFSSAYTILSTSGRGSDDNLSPFHLFPINKANQPWLLIMAWCRFFCLRVVVVWGYKLSQLAITFSIQRRWRIACEDENTLSGWQGSLTTPSEEKRFPLCLRRAGTSSLSRSFERDLWKDSQCWHKCFHSCFSSSRIAIKFRH